MELGTMVKDNFVYKIWNQVKFQGKYRKYKLKIL